MEALTQLNVIEEAKLRLTNAVYAAENGDLHSAVAELTRVLEVQSCVTTIRQFYLSRKGVLRALRKSQLHCHFAVAFVPGVVRNTVEKWSVWYDLLHDWKTVFYWISQCSHCTCTVHTSVFLIQNDLQLRCHFSTIVNLCKCYIRKDVEKWPGRYNELYDYKTALCSFCGVLCNVRLQISPSDASTRNKRAHVLEQIGDIPASIADLRHIAKLRAEHTEPHLQLSLALHRNGDAEESLNAIRECLKLDADDKPCKTHYSFLRKLVKQLQGIQEEINNNQYAECVPKCEAVLKTDPNTPRIVREVNNKLCLCLSKTDGPRAVKLCSALLEQEPNNHDFLLNRAEAFIVNEQFDEGEKKHSEAFSLDIAP